MWPKNVHIEVEDLCIRTALCVGNGMTDYVFDCL